jgi:hypothetical protein
MVEWRHRVPADEFLVRVGRPAGPACSQQVGVVPASFAGVCCVGRSPGLAVVGHAFVQEKVSWGRVRPVAVCALQHALLGRVVDPERLFLEPVGRVFFYVAACSIPRAARRHVGVVPADGALLRADVRPYEGRRLPAEVAAKVLEQVGVRVQVAAKSYILFLGARSAMPMRCKVAVLVGAVVSEIVAPD